MNTAIQAPTGLSVDNQIIYIPLDKLHRSPHNVRTIELKDEQDAELHASILADGLYKNLIAVMREDGDYDIPAGGRRLGSLALHAKEGNIPSDLPIPCLVKNGEDSVAISLAENLTHKAMHPADACAGFLKLHKQGVSVAQIASRFGYTVAKVERYLRLSQLNATLLKHFRANRLTLDQAMTYAATPDKKLQLAVFRALGDNTSASVGTIRKHIEDSRVRSDTGLAKFVGMDAYVAAGGKYWDDLFTGVKLLDDMSILVALADQKLEEAARSLEGWKWIITDHEGVGYRHQYRKLPFAEEIPESEKAKLDALASEFLAIQEEFEALTYPRDAKEEADLDERYDAKEAEIAALEYEHTQRYRVYNNKDQGGCVVTFSHDTGKLFIFYGLQSPDDVRKPVSGDSANSGFDEQADKLEEKKASLAAVTNGKADGINKKLIEDLGQYRREIIRAELLDNPDEARDLLEFHLCQNLLSSTRWNASTLEFRVDPTEDTFHDDDTAAHKAAEAIAHYQKSLNLSWLKSDKPLKQYSQFRALSRSDRDRLLCFVAASSLKAGTELPNRMPLMDDLVIRLETDFRQYFTPNAANYFSRLRTDQLLALGHKLLGKSWTDSHTKSTKKQLVVFFDNLFSSPDTELTDKALEIRNEWLPPQIKK